MFLIESVCVIALELIQCKSIHLVRYECRLWTGKKKHMAYLTWYLSLYHFGQCCFKFLLVTFYENVAIASDGGNILQILPRLTLCDSNLGVIFPERNNLNVTYRVEKKSALLILSALSGSCCCFKRRFQITFCEQNLSLPWNYYTTKRQNV